MVDGANAWQTFWRVVFPAMRPINIVDRWSSPSSSRCARSTWSTSPTRAPNGLELLSVAGHQNIVGETQRIGFGSALGVVLLVISLVPISALPLPDVRAEEAR